jgi:hypothetical protein
MQKEEKKNKYMLNIMREKKDRKRKEKEKRKKRKG